MRQATSLALRAVLLAAVLAALATPAVADAASVAYVDNGEVWLASLDGTKKARLATTVVNSDGDTEKWLDVAQSDGGRIVAVRNKPGRISNFSWFKIWEPDGTSTVEGPLNAPSGLTSYTYPLGFDITANGSHLVYGYSNSGSCCPTPFGRGTYVRPATNSTLNPIDTGSQTHPSLFGSRIISLEDSSSPSFVNVQDAGAGNPYTNNFTTWLDASARPARPRRRRRRGQREPGGTRVRGVERRDADGRQDRRHRDPGRRSAAHVHRLLLPARGRHRTGRIARAGRRIDRVEGRRRREGRRQPHGHRRSLRDGKRAGRALADRRVPVDRRRRRGRVPARTAARDAARRPWPGPWPGRRRRPPPRG